MNIGHTDFEERKDTLTGEVYMKCSTCKKVAFPSDYFFNMVCLPKAEALVGLRERLENDDNL